ncbi:MAG: tail fiber protein [Rhizomicrobium sp.]
MSEPFLAEIKIMSFAFAPRGWALCNGQLLPINQNQALFSLLGTTYGGNGQTTFALPNLQGQVPIHVGQGHALGEKAGTTAETLGIAQLPQHIHQMVAVAAQADAGTQLAPGPTVALAQGYAAQSGGGQAPINMYGTGTPSNFFHPSAVSNAGGSQAHTNMQPYLTLNFCIALTGIFPSPT